MKEEFDIEEDVNALLEGEELSEEFQEKARTIFEAALRSKVSEIQEAMEHEYAVLVPSRLWLSSFSTMSIGVYMIALVMLLLVLYITFDTSNQ